MFVASIYLFNFHQDYSRERRLHLFLAILIQKQQVTPLTVTAEWFVLAALIARQNWQVYSLKCDARGL